MLVSIWTEEPASLTKYDFIKGSWVHWVFVDCTLDIYVYAEALKVVGTWFLAWAYDLMCT